MPSLPEDVKEAVRFHEKAKGCWVEGLKAEGNTEGALPSGHFCEVMSATMDEFETLRSIKRGLEEMEAGETVDSSAVLRRLREL